MTVVVFENDRQGPGPCSACGTNGAHYCPADLCGPDCEECGREGAHADDCSLNPDRECEYCGRPEADEGLRLCEQCRDDIATSKARQRR